MKIITARHKLQHQRYVVMYHGLQQQNLIGLFHQICWCRNGNETESTYFLHQ